MSAFSDSRTIGDRPRIIFTHTCFARKQPGPDYYFELIAALDIAENILRTIYVLPKLSKKVTTGRKI